MTSCGHRGAVLAAVALGSALGWAAACTVPNTDHCLHKDFDSNAWCGEHVPDRPFCSPCDGEEHGCVAQEPTAEECPEYAGPGAGTGTGPDSGTDSGTGTDAGTGTD